MSRKTWVSSELWKKLKPIAREMRHEPTQAEDVLWQRLRHHQIAGAQFRRQHPVGPFIVDFYCPNAKLVVEVDGPIHQYTSEEDAVRQEYLEALELRVIRFTNEQVLNEIGSVITQITEAVCNRPHPPAPSPLHGEGE